MELFKAWAFAAGPPTWNASGLVQEIVANCGRLPLTLKVCTFQALTLFGRTWMLLVGTTDLASSRNEKKSTAGQGRPPEVSKRQGRGGTDVVGSLDDATEC